MKYTPKLCEAMERYGFKPSFDHWDKTKVNGYYVTESDWIGSDNVLDYLYDRYKGTEREIEILSLMLGADE